MLALEIHAVFLRVDHFIKLHDQYNTKMMEMEGLSAMSWTGWVVIGIIGVNVVGFGLMALWFYAVERRRRR